MIRREDALAYHNGSRPGKIEIHGAVKSCSRADDSMPPQLGVGGCAPSPRNDSRRASISPAMSAAATDTTRLGCARHDQAISRT
jgi:hypothetical protein